MARAGGERLEHGVDAADEVHGVWVRPLSRAARSRARRCPRRGRGRRGGRCSWPSPRPAAALHPERAGDRRRASRSRWGASTGSWAMTVTSRFTSGVPGRVHEPADLLEEDAARDAAPARRRGSGSGAPCRPRPPPRAARRTRRAARSRRRSGPRGRAVCAPRRPPRRSGRPATRRWASKPWPIADGGLMRGRRSREHALGPGEVLGRRDLAVARRAGHGAHTACPRRSTAIASSVSVTPVARAAS